MLKGWEAIEKHAKWCRHTIKRLAEERNFPIFYVGRYPCSTKEAIQKWIIEQIELNQNIPPENHS